LNDVIYSFASRSQIIASNLHQRLHYDCIRIEPDLHHLKHLFGPGDVLISMEYLLIDLAVNAGFENLEFSKMNNWL
jgi:hypothetical protein